MGKQEYQPEWIREDFIDFIAEKFHPTWALHKVKAMIVAKKILSPDFAELTLHPNENFQHGLYQAGQSILVTVTVRGVRHQRSYSIVEITPTGDLKIAVKKQGKVSDILNQAAVKKIVEISQPQGDFVLKDLMPSVFVASGSGITAIYALVKEFLAKSIRSADLIYFHRDHAYEDELQNLAKAYPQFTYHSIHTPSQKQHLDANLIKTCISDLEDRWCYGCGTAAMIQALKDVYASENLSQKLSVEYFQIPTDLGAEIQPVRFVRSERDFSSQGSVLMSAEQAGLKPKSGCRMGICNSCSCTKLEGSVKNILTGEIDHQSNTQIKLCISQAISPLKINL